MRFRTGVTLAVILVLQVVGCADRNRARQEIERIRQAEQTIRPFTPDALHDSTQQHFAVAFRIVADSLEFLPDSVTVRPGRMPYRPSGAGDFTVTAFDSTGTKVVGYTMEDPRIVRSCDFPSGGQAETKLLSSGRVELLVPADPAIRSLEVSSGTRVQRFPPTGQMLLPP